MDKLIQELADKHGTSAGLLEELLAWERTKVHLKKRRNKIAALRQILEQNLPEDAR